MNTKKHKILFFVTVDWFFYSHFLQRALAAKDEGYDVAVVAKFDNHKERIEAAGIRAIPIELERRSINPFSAASLALKLSRIYRIEKPDIVHHVAIKPILIGGLASILSRSRPKIVNAIVGMGYIFTGNSLKSRLIRPFIQLGFRLLLNPKASKVVFENEDDRADFVRVGAVRQEDALLIRGAGVEPEEFWLAPDRSMTPVTIFVARLLWDKGIGDLIDAIRILKRRGVPGRFVIVGNVDPGNPACIDGTTLTEWKNEGLAEFLGHRTDVPALLSQSDIACLPSYREGLPKSLLEAMASGLPCVTTDTPGCREVVRDGDNGFLVPVHSPVGLANSLEHLLSDPSLRSRMGARGKQRVREEFSTDIVVEETLGIYTKLLGLQKARPDSHAA